MNDHHIKTAFMCHSVPIFQCARFSPLMVTQRNRLTGLREQAPTICTFFSKILLTRVKQLKTDLAQYCTLYSKCQLQKPVTPFCDFWVQLTESQQNIFFTKSARNISKFNSQTRLPPRSQISNPMTTD